MGAQLCIFCSCEAGLLSEHKLSAYRAMPISRATENGIYLLMANTPANPDDIPVPRILARKFKDCASGMATLSKRLDFSGMTIISATIDLSQATGSQAEADLQ